MPDILEFFDTEVVVETICIVCDEPIFDPLNPYMCPGCEEKAQRALWKDFNIHLENWLSERGLA